MTSRYPQVGDRVRVCMTLHFNNQEGVLHPNSGHEEDPWDFNVRLDNGRHIGVDAYQVDVIGRPSDV